MTTIEKQALLPYPREALYALVVDVEEYGHYLPGCESVRVHDQDEQSMLATMTIKKLGMRASFTTKNTMLPPSTVTMSLVEGPFEHLEGAWTFTECEGGCQVVFSLQFAFKYGMTDMLFTSSFETLAGTILEAFCKRAHEKARGNV